MTDPRGLRPFLDMWPRVFRSWTRARLRIAAEIEAFLSGESRRRVLAVDRGEGATSIATLAAAWAVATARAGMVVYLARSADSAVALGASLEELLRSGRQDLRGWPCLPVEGHNIVFRGWQQASRGIVLPTISGRVLRPDVVIVDADDDTRRSSPALRAKFLDAVNGRWLNVGGPGQPARLLQIATNVPFSAAPDRGPDPVAGPRVFDWLDDEGDAI